MIADIVLHEGAGRVAFNFNNSDKCKKAELVAMWRSLRRIYRGISRFATVSVKGCGLGVCKSFL